MSGRFRARVEELCIVGAYGSGASALWAAGQATAAVPFVTLGRAHHHTARVDGHTASLICVGRRRRFEEIFSRVSDRIHHVEEGRLYPLWRPASLSELSADLVAAEVHRWLAPRFRRRGWLIVPQAIRWSSPVGPPPFTGLSKSVRADLRKVRQGGFLLEPAETSADWEHFRRRMAIPLARSRYGMAAWIPSTLYLNRLAKRGCLLFVRLRGSRVAGVCLVPVGDKLWVAQVGLKDGRPDLLKAGALTALYVLLPEWACERGFRRMDWGRSSPFVRDGLYTYKRKWGFTPFPDPLAPRVALRLGAERTAVRNAFEKQPVTIEADGTATGLRIFGGEVLGSSEDAEGDDNPEDAASDPLAPGHRSTGS